MSIEEDITGDIIEHEDGSVTDEAGKELFEVPKNYECVAGNPLEEKDNINSPYALIIGTAPIKSEALDALAAKINALSQLAKSGDTSAVKQYKYIVDALMFTTKHDHEAGIVEKKEASFKNAVKVPNVNATIFPRHITKPKNLSPGAKLAYKFRNKYSKETSGYFPLWNSFIWIKLEPISATDINNFIERNYQENKEVGYATNGLCYASGRAKFMRGVTELITGNISMSSIGVSGKEIINYIDPNDYQVLCTYAASTLFSEGFEYTHRCASDPTTCQHETHGMINPRKLVHVDTSMVTPEEITFMHNAQLKLIQAWSKIMNKGDLKDAFDSIESVTKMRNNFYSRFDNSFVYDSAKFYCRMPYLSDFFNTSDKWLDSVVKSNDLVLVKGSKAREEFITAQKTAMALSEYASYIYKIEDIDPGEDEEAYSCEDADDITTALNAISKDGAARDFISDKISSFPVSTSICAVGFPPYTCPSCGKPADKVASVDGENTQYKFLIALQADDVFFHLVSWAYELRKREI